MLVSFGEIMLRLAPPRMERFFQSPELVATFGGGEANVAVAVAGFGLPARYITVLPEKHPAAEAQKRNKCTIYIMYPKLRHVIQICAFLNIQMG